MTDERVTWRDRGFPDGDVPLTEVGAQGWRLLDGDFVLPIVALRATALERNLALMEGYCRRHDVLVAPHAKTTMSPALVARQIAAGAWGVTVANVQQARVFITAGVRRVLVANPVVGAADLGYLAACRRADPGLEVILLVDSVEGVALLADRAVPDPADQRPLAVLLELGYDGGRGGARTTEEAVRVAEAVRATAGLELVGVEGFEGLVPGADDAERRGRAADFLAWSAEVVHRLVEDGLLPARGVVVSFGGSSYFDLVVDRFRARWTGERVEVLLRSGCYLTHDHGLYARTSPFVGEEPPPLPALEVWAEVLSRPEPGLAILGAGRRDVSTDADLPLPVAVRHRGRTRPAGGLRVTAVNDQHAMLAVPDDVALEVGDLVCLGVSHPCTTFDKWRLLPVVSDEYEVTDAVRTYF
ncbi:alanine racemase [Pimelobacter simplex]|uniref:D-serine deaminase n=1 Tax=Nocardioides simplex TaxID=2045 RepID=A0A0A1DHZ7_NOCSI|nr:alanine racemase [Pimelobacter simplex]AIY16919.1 D-serine deaminase [Pimelobacter simplex]MCG8152055.1 alanine racemase [Pimelobacter simplex]GEB12808.1 amino acid deaminase [Pimelobacter simplex]SFM53938.1 D-serine dehydratase [Pimelobacter simplex]